MRKNKKDLRIQIDPDSRKNRHRRKAGKKTWRIQYRRVKSAYSTRNIEWFHNRYGDTFWDWRDYYTKYETKKARDQALKTLIKQSKSQGSYHRLHEYRLPPDEENLEKS